MRLVTLQQAYDYLRADADQDQANVELMVEAASAAVVNYLGDGADSWLDSQGEPILDSNGEADDVPAAVKMAVLYLAAWFYRNRDADPEKAFHPGYLPAPVTAMLYPLRDPTLA